MIKITTFAFTAYPVTDLARARAFYEKLLGLKPATAWEGDGKGDDKLAALHVPRILRRTKQKGIA